MSTAATVASNSSAHLVDSLSVSRNSPSTPTNAVNNTMTTGTMTSMYATLVGGNNNNNNNVSDPDDTITPPPDARTSNSPRLGSSSKHPLDEEYPYSIRLTPFVDHSSNIPSLYVQTVERKAKELPFSIKIGRYPDKKEDAKLPAEIAPIVFKSKVVSRCHAEFFVQQGQWFIKDIQSSSGTFLNHVRLAPAATESEPFALSDGDILQLGMDFRGGAEEIYKCIKVRVELNRSWVQKPKDYNINTLTNLRNLFAQQASAASPAKDNLNECAICLLPVQPCQALFIAPCSHNWHYKCIRPVIIRAYPHFHCPNCRSICDLEEEIVADLTSLSLMETKIGTGSPD